MMWNPFKKKTAPTFNGMFEFTETEAKHARAVDQSDTSEKSKAAKIPTAFLKRLLPLGQLLTEDEVQSLSIDTETFAPGKMIFVRGMEIDALVYLIKGTAYLETADGFGQEISEGTLKALFPLSSGEFHQFTAYAKSNVTVIYIPKSIMAPNRTPINPLKNPVLASSRLRNNPFFIRFHEHFSQGNLRIPSFPDVALKLRRAALQDIGISEAVKIVNMDPVVAAKLIQIVNSPIYRTLNPITNCHDAVNRLGLKNTMHLVTAISMKNLIRSEKPEIKRFIQETWMESIKVSSICHALAQLTRQVNPEEALLAGLLHNIGILPLLLFADQLPGSDFSKADLEFCIEELQGQLGSIILEKWEFPDDFRAIPIKSGNWFDNSGDKMQLSDIVLLAKFHHSLTRPNGPELPLINTLPAFQKLDHQLLTPEMSLQVLQDAKQQISETMKFFMV